MTAASPSRLYQYVVVYNPEQRLRQRRRVVCFARRCLPGGPARHGIGHLGLRSALRRTASRPEGHAMFRLHEADLRFKGTASSGW